MARVGSLVRLCLKIKRKERESSISFPQNKATKISSLRFPNITSFFSVSAHVGSCFICMSSRVLSSRTLLLILSYLVALLGEVPDHIFCSLINFQYVSLSRFMVRTRCPVFNFPLNFCNIHAF